MQLPQRSRGKVEPPFETPKLFTPSDTPGYQPSYYGNQITDCNLVLEGGAMRGQFTAGVLDFFMDKGLFAKTVVGVSAGALNGYNYVAGARGRTCFLNTTYCADWRYLSMRSYAVTGNAFGAEFSFDQIPNKLHPFDYVGFSASPCTLHVASSDLDTGEADYHVLRDPRGDISYLQASSAMPLVSKIVEIDGKNLLDGGICDSVPIEFSRFLNNGKQIVVLTQDATYIKESNKVMPLVRKVYTDYPYFVERMEGRHVDYNRCYRRLQRMHDTGEVFVIRPPKPVEVGSMEKDAEKLYRLYEDGYEEARRNWGALQAYLNG